MGILDKILPFTQSAPVQILQQQPQTIKKILIVESDEGLRAQFIRLLQSDQFEVASVGTGADALNLLLTFRPDLALVDINLPVMSGKEMIHHMRSIPEYKTTPIVAISDTGDVDTIRQVKTYDNASAFLIKSNVSIDEIINTVKSFV